MRLSICFLLLIFSNTLISQNWKTAEWQTVGSTNVSGFAYLPLNGIIKSSDVLLKRDLYDKPFREDNLMYLKIETDTLIEYTFYEGWNYKLLPLIKGKVSLYKGLAKKRKIKYFLEKDNELVLIDKDTIEVAYAHFLQGSCTKLSKKSMSPYLFHDRALMRLTQELNECLDEKQIVWAFNRPEYKWSYFIGIQSELTVGQWFFSNLSNKRENRFHLGFDRQIGSSFSPLFYELQLSYVEIHGETTYRNRSYDVMLDVFFANITTGFRLEMLPRRNISPFVFGGIGLSFPFKFVRTLRLIPNHIPYTWPNYQELKTRLPINKGNYWGIGLRLNLSPRYKLNFTLRIEKIKFLLDLKRRNDLEYLLDLREAHDDEINNQLIGFTLRRTF